MSDHATDILDTISSRKALGQPFALATVVRTVAATAAKAGAKAVILPDGTISEGWIGGGCARVASLAPFAVSVKSLLRLPFRWKVIERSYDSAGKSHLR